MDGRRGRAIKISKNNPPPSPHCSIPVPPQLRYIIFPPGFKYIPPPPPPPDSISITVPRRPSRQSESITIVPHDRFPGVYVSKHDANYLYTKSLVPAQPPLYHDDIVISVKDNDGSVVEYREWDPYRSKLAAAILSGAQNIWIKPGSRVLVIYSRDDDRFGITISLILLDLKMVDPSCLVTNKFWTAPSSQRGDGERVTIYEQLKDLPVFMLFESSCGYALFRVQEPFKVERNYIAIEKYINRGDVFELIAYQPFESADDALVHLNAVCNETVYQQLIDFLVLHLPTPMEGGKHRYSLALFSGGMARDILHNTKIASLSDLFHVDIIRGVRMHIDKFIKNMKPGELEKAQLDLARNYCRQKLISPDEGKSQKKRGGFQASIPLRRRNPKRKAQTDAKTNS